MYTKEQIVYFCSWRDMHNYTSFNFSHENPEPFYSWNNCEACHGSPGNRYSILCVNNNTNELELAVVCEDCINMLINGINIWQEYVNE